MAVKTAKWCILAVLTVGPWGAWAQPVAEVVSGEDEDRPEGSAPPTPAGGKAGASAGTPAAEPAPSTAASAAASEERPEDRLPADADVTPAREVYNAGRYEEAAARFLALCQRHPGLPALYRALARSRAWQGDPGGAVLAYEVYLAAAPSAADRTKVEAERDLARRKAEGAGGVPKGVPGAAQLDQAAQRVQAGRIAGPDGALAALNAALKAGWFGPRQAEVETAILDGLGNSAREALDAWWAPEARFPGERLQGLAEGLSALARRRPPTPQERLWAAGVQGLLALSVNDAPTAADHLAEVAPADPRLRFAQALALVQLGRDAEAADLLAALAARLPDPRVQALRGLVLNRLGRADEALEALQAALNEG